MIKEFFNAIIHNEGKHTIYKTVHYLNCLLMLFWATSLAFPIQNIFDKYLESLNIAFVSDIVLLAWYCTTFLFCTIVSIFWLFLIVYSILEFIKNKIFKDNVWNRNKKYTLTEMSHTIFCAARNAYLNVFDFLVLFSLMLFFISPEILFSTFNVFFKFENSIDLLKLFIIPCALESAIFTLRDIFISLFIPKYYEYQYIVEKNIQRYHESIEHK